RGQDRRQLAHGRAGGQAGRPPRRGPADRAGDRDHDGRPLALRGPPRPRRGHRSLQRRARAHLPGPGLLRPRRAPTPAREAPTVTMTEDLEAARAALVMINPAPYNAEAPPAALEGEITAAGEHYVRSNFAVPAHDGTLHVGGAVEQPVTLTLEDLRAMP